jgi:hypothetical protein
MEASAMSTVALLCQRSVRTIMETADCLEVGFVVSNGAMLRSLRCLR